MLVLGVLLSRVLESRGLLSEVLESKMLVPREFILEILVLLPVVLV